MNKNNTLGFINNATSGLKTPQFTQPINRKPAGQANAQANPRAQANTQPANTNTKSAKDQVKYAVEAAKNKKWVSIIIQVALGLVATYIIYLIAIHIMNVDKLVIDDKYDLAKKRKVRVIDGYIDAATRNVRYNTVMPVANNYLPIRPSVNVKGGAQFTYSFWVHRDANADTANKIIFIKGDDKRYNFSIVDNMRKVALQGQPAVNQVVEKTNEHMVFCPMVKFGNDGLSYEVKFNTLNRYDETFVVDRMTSADSTTRNNLLSTLDGTWHLITITFEDNIPINDFENGIMIKFYVNDVLYKVGRFSSALKQNQGDLVLFPNSSPISNVKISNFAYYNYVLSETEIHSISLSGASTSTSTAYMTPTATKPPVLSDYNKLDIYNI